MVDFRSRSEIAMDKRRQLAIQKDHKVALEKMTQQVAGKLEVLEQRTNQLAQGVGMAVTEGRDARANITKEVNALNDDISRLHAMIADGGEQEMKLIEQMQKNQQQRHDNIVKLIANL